MLRTSWIVVAALMAGGCQGPAEGPLGTASEDSPKPAGVQMSPTATPEDAPSDNAVLPAEFAGIDPQDAAARGPSGMRQARDVFHQLLTDHDKIRREVEDLDHGVRTVTTSEDPEVAALIRLHVRQMKARLDAGMGVRNWDPVFAELHRHYDKIVFEIEDVPGGVRVVETSEDAQVVLLIKQHAHRGVSEFVERGFDRAHEPSPLPEGYTRD